MPVKGSRACIPRGDHHHLHLTSRHSGTCNPPAVQVNHGISRETGSRKKRGSKGQPTHTDSQRGGRHYWQRPSGENAAGAKRGRPAPGEQGRGGKGARTVEEPGEAGSFDGNSRAHSFFEKEGALFWNIPSQRGRSKCGLPCLPSFLYRAVSISPHPWISEWREPHAGRPARTVWRGIRPTA